MSGAKVVVRLDLNVPLNGRTISDDVRVRVALPTLRTLQSHQNKILVVAHLGRPDRLSSNRNLSLRPVSDCLSRLLEKEVPLVAAIAGWESKTPGSEMVLLENIRFDPRETSRSAAERCELAAELRANADIVVSDAFSTFHRHHATIVELVELGLSVPGMLVETELQGLAPLLSSNVPLLVIFGGTRAEEKLRVLDELTETSVTVLLGAPMAAQISLLAARAGLQGTTARRILEKKNLVVPPDITVQDEAGRLHVTRLSDVLPATRVVDLGPKACIEFGERVRTAQAVIWNGPPGFQHERYARRGAEALATACAESLAVTIVGGGTTGMPLRWLGLTNRVTHISTGGTVLFHLLLGRSVPGLDAVLNSSGA
ncbi:MAG TPA: phosphoglycerate kinase [Conexibacter sp.]